MVNSHTNDTQQVVLEAMTKVLALYNSLRRTGGKGYVGKSGKLMEGFRRWRPRCRKSWPEEYQEFSEFMEAFRECIKAGIYQVFTIKRSIVETSSFQYKSVRNSIQIDNDSDTKVSFYIQEINSQNDCEVTQRFYDILTSTGGKLLDADNEFIKDFEYTGVVSFLDFLRLTFIYYQIVHEDFQHIRVCKFLECSNFFYSKRLGEKRWQYCTDECRKWDMPEDIKEMRNCQKKMRAYFSNALNRYSEIKPLEDIGNIKLSFVDDLCADCKYKHDPKESRKGDCHQALSHQEIVRIVNTLGQHKKKL